MTTDLQAAVIAAAVEWFEAHDALIKSDSTMFTDNEMLERYRVACDDLRAVVSQNRDALTAFGYTLVRTDELEAAITAYLANDDPGLRGAMADLSATREMALDFADRPVSELIAEAGAEPVENPADLELQGISDESWAALETMQEERS